MQFRRAMSASPVIFLASEKRSRVRECSSVPYRCFTSFGKAALMRHNQVRTTKRYMVWERFSSYCSLWWVKLQTNPMRLSSTNAMSLWKKSSGRSLTCNKLSISTPGFRSLSLSSFPGNSCHSCSHSWHFVPIRIKRNKAT